MRFHARVFICTGAIAFTLVAGTGAAAQQADPHRDQIQRLPDVFAALGATRGSRIADVGAGGGYFTYRLSDAVGSEGRVFAVDVGETAVRRLQQGLRRAGIDNVELLLGETDDPRLPYASLDGALIVNAYHEMTEYGQMLHHLRKALRPGGRLVILDNPPGDEAGDRAAQTERHEIDIGIVESELRDAGFEVLARAPDFVSEPHEDHRHHEWMLTAQRPLQDPPAQRLAAASLTSDGLFACAFPGTPSELRERASPPDSVDLAVRGARIRVCYSQPSARERTVMGELVPYDEPWRTGANEATLLRIDGPITVGETTLQPGWYSLYTIPGERVWSVVVNRLVERQGAPIDEWIRSHDVAQVTVSPEATDRHVETLTMQLVSDGSDAAVLVIEWERTQIRVPLAIDGS